MNIEAKQHGPEFYAEDLRETAAAIYHRDMAKFQLSQWERMQEFRVKVCEWANKQAAKGCEGASLDCAVSRELGQAHAGQREERRQVERQMLARKDELEAGIEMWAEHTISPEHV